VREPAPDAVAVLGVRGAGGEVLAQDLVLASNVVRHPDFAEGVRAQLVDKDRTPRWVYGWVGDVPREVVLAAFRPA
jgi:enoyl-CoA hydratase